ncbi:MAG TPA: hypothetical protein VMS17_11160, partial [Gemmataceae bacterium]|nr:hypothetical protein [Gemmataceae bacterium]
MASTTSFKQQCPSCEAMVPIRDPGLIGRKIDCPKCKYRFVVEKPKSKTNDDDEDSSSDTPAPTKKAKKPGAAAAAAARAPAKQGIKTGAPGKVKTTPTRRRDEDDEEDDRPRKKQGGASTTVIIGASLGGLAVLAVVVCILVMTLGGKGNNSSSSNSNNNSSNNQQPNNNPQPGPKPPPNFVPPPGGVFIADVTNLLPNDAEAVVNYQIDRLHDSGLGQSALSPGAFSEKAFRDTFSFPLYTADGKGVERVVTAISHTKNWIFSILHTQKGLTINKDNVIASLQLDGLDEVNGLKPYSVKRDFDGIGTLLIKANRPHPDLQMLFLDDHTLVFADPEPMQKFLSDVKQFNGHPEYKSQPTQPTPPANQNAGAGGMNNPNNPNPGWTGPQIGGGASAGAGAGAGPGGSGGPPNNPNSGMMNPNGGGTGPMGPGLQGGAGAGAGGSGGPPNNPNGGMMNPNGGGTGGPMGGAGQPPGNKPPSTAQLAGSYLTIEPAMKAMFDRIEKTDQPLLVSAVTSTKDPMVEQLGVLLRDRGASWATSKEIAVDEKTRMLLDLLKIYRPQDLPAVWVGFSLTDCASDKVTGVAAVDMGSQATAAKLSTALKDLVAHANAMLGGGSQTPAENGTNQGGMFPGGTFRPGGSGAGPGAGAPAPPPPPGMGMGPGSGAPPAPPPPPGGTGPGNNPNNPNGGGTFQPGGTFNPNGGNPNGGENNQGAPVLWLTQEGSLVLLNAAIT